MIEIVVEGRGKNALGTGIMRSLRERFHAAGSEPVLLTGAGDALSAGLDLKEVASLDALQMRAFLELLEETMRTVFLHPAPTVALVNGHAIAGGSVLALCCDWRVAARVPKARIGLNEVALGLRFPPHVLAICRHRLPPQHFETVVLGAALYDPENAARVGLVDEVADDARKAAEDKLAALAAMPRAAYADLKSTLRAPLVAHTAETGRYFEHILPSWTSPELKERIAKALAR